MPDMLSNVVRESLLAGYYCASSPWRWVSARCSASQGACPVIVLFYHRIADHHPNDWTMSTQAFTQQINWLQRNFDLVSLSEAQARLHSGCNSRPAVAITFDDGYADNCRFALPLLAQRKIPLTYFVTTHHILNGEPFPHDVSRGQPLPPNTVDQLRSLTKDGVEIGAHTRSHADLGKKCDHEYLLDEIVIAGEELQAAVGQTIRYFAFPYGQVENLSAEAFNIAYDAGYEGVCSAYGGYNFPGDDVFHLQRFHADPSLIRLKNWLTVDPRWRNRKRFQYKRPRSLSEMNLQTID